MVAYIRKDDPLSFLLKLKLDIHGIDYTEQLCNYNLPMLELSSGELLAYPEAIQYIEEEL